MGDGLELVASLADMGHIGESLAFLFEFEVLGFGRSVFIAQFACCHR